MWFCYRESTNCMLAKIRCKLKPKNHRTKIVPHLEHMINSTFCTTCQPFHHNWAIGSFLYFRRIFCIVYNLYMQLKYTTMRHAWSLTKKKFKKNAQGINWNTICVIVVTRLTGGEHFDLFKQLLLGTMESFTLHIKHLTEVINN